MFLLASPSDIWNLDHCQEIKKCEGIYEGDKHLDTESNRVRIPADKLANMNVGLAGEGAVGDHYQYPLNGILIAFDGSISNNHSYFICFTCKEDCNQGWNNLLAVIESKLSIDSIEPIKYTIIKLENNQVDKDSEDKE